MEYDFSGWATKNNIECSDGRTIMKDAFKHNDGAKVPLVWNHQHDDPSEVLGHAVLENRDDGVYAYCKFNDTESGQTARSLVVNGDVDKLSIYANKLQTRSNKVIHGMIREVSLVLAGANPGAYIDSVVVHSDGAEQEEEGTIYTNESIEMAEEKPDEKPEENPEEESNSKKEEEIVDKENLKHADEEKAEKTVGEVFDTFSEEQKEVVYALIGQAVEDAKGESDSEDNNQEKEGEDTMKHNVFDKDKNQEDVLKHSEFVNASIADAKKFGSMRDSFMAHADEYGFDPANGFTPLFPDAVNVDKEPRMVEKDNSWVANVMANVKHSPFSRVKSTFGRMSEPEARAKGYVKGDKKTNIKMSFLNRVTTPTTVYIKNDIDRDDIVDITDFDIVAWQKKELRKGLDRELALAILLGDGRDVSDVNKINEQNIRPIVSDNEMFTINYVVTSGVDYAVEGNSASENDSVAKGIIRSAIRARKQYKGSGKPTFYTTEDVLTDLLLIEDQNGRVMYDSIDKLATAMRVKEIVTIPEMEAEAYTNIYGIIVNLNDYTAGADKGGSVNMFDDFDIDYNQMKYLMETRMSGALTVPFSAIVLKKTAGTTPVEG